MFLSIYYVNEIKVYFLKMLPPIEVTCMLLHPQAFHLWHVEEDLKHLTKLLAIQVYHDSSLAPRSILQFFG